MSPVLRQALRSDIPGIFRVRYAVSENRLTSRSISEGEVVEALESTGRGWIVESGGEVVAFAIGNLQAASIWALFVDPKHEGLGYGRCLHDTVVDWLWSCGLERLWLTTEPGTRAQRFYERSGWICCGFVPSGELRFELSKPSQSPPQ
jgi:GNAT superfamily N-acetyltransferase